ncbi:hypothetical protein BKA70DRAFT_177736 [Coprinopsis sp. MPI-PUGE-AT-0042]|nr:hypothetical protein BKA70DRAFT_177736 [Coprinopsis sp. MPI-PUGE-AT-0042]
MIAWGQATEADSIIHDYPWKALAPGTSLCDVGGGIGTMTVKLAKAHPHLKLKLQDTPERMIQAQEGLLAKRVPRGNCREPYGIQGDRFLCGNTYPRMRYLLPQKYYTRLGIQGMRHYTKKCAESHETFKQGPIRKSFLALLVSLVCNRLHRRIHCSASNSLPIQESTSK